MVRYNPSEIEPRWQSFWDEHKTFQTPSLADAPAGTKKRYILDMFPYPSGDGLHVGHPEGYTATDIVSRFARARGECVLHPMGFDAFGLPAEEHAIKTGEHPRIQTQRNIDNFTRQLKLLGFSYDWDRVLATTDENYFRWTQWIFTVLYDTWFDHERQKGRPMSELSIPDEVSLRGAAAIEQYQDAKRLAYQDNALVNWCPNLGTVLANEEVVDGKSEVGGHPVKRMPLRQWMLRITDYAERLIDGLDDLDWPNGIKKLQSDWIGRSSGAEVDFYLATSDSAGENVSPFSAFERERKSVGFPATPDDDTLRVYTTRPDTLFGATYMVVSPEHPSIDRLVTGDHKPIVDAYREKASFKSDRERTDGDRAKTGVFTGTHAINPANGELIPVWVADYVLAGYGTGAIMAVPAHDIRDFEFAVIYDLPVIPVVNPPADHEQYGDIMAGKACYAAEGVAINSGEYEGKTTAEVKSELTTSLTQRGLGHQAINYKLRDWLFSRQRFWGEPFPILHEIDADGNPTGVKRVVPDDQLPVTLPDLEDFKPYVDPDSDQGPQPPLAKADDDWLIVSLDGKRYRREVNTMPQWAGSCWYYLRYIDPNNTAAFVDPDLEKQWMPVDLYVGGAEHAVLHLLYSRFWHKVLYDRGHVSVPEPFGRLVNQGMILGEVEYSGYVDDSGKPVSSKMVRKDADGNRVTKDGSVVKTTAYTEDQVTKKGEGFVLSSDASIKIESRAFKMSKSRGNVVNPDAVVDQYGADSLRLYEMFMGPLEATKPWAMNGVGGVRSFLDRVWRLIVDDIAEELTLIDAVVDMPCNEDQLRILHQTIRKVTEDTETMSFNTAISKMMEFTNFFTKCETRPRSAMESFLILLAPYAPHLCEELWNVLGHNRSISHESWPTWDEAAIKQASIEIPVQINGKVRAKISIDPDADQGTIEQIAMESEAVRAAIQGKQIVKSIIVPGRMVNLVVK